LRPLLSLSPALVALALAAAPLTAAAPPAAAQTEGNLFAPVRMVNGRAITGFEVAQRTLFLTALRAPGDPRDQALRTLTDDRLRQAEAKRLGLTVPADEVEQGMADMAARAGLSVDQFVEALTGMGIAVETWRDFVATSLLWREVVRARHAGRVAVSEAEVDAALAAQAREVPLRVLIAELVIPLAPRSEQAGLDLAARLSREVTTEGAFAAAARRHSAAPTAGAGGRLDWVPLANLPPQIAGAVLGLMPGQTSRPVVVPGAVALFQLRGVEEDRSAPRGALQVAYAEAWVPDTAEDLARLRAGADACLDLYALFQGQPEGALTLHTLPAAALPQDVALELAGLDAGETSAVQVRGGLRRVLMLCGRSALPDAAPAGAEAEDGTAEGAAPDGTAPDRAAVREALLNRKLEGLAEAYLEELRAAALIREP
jgi:peptidyl-prolyl cis-trans isomerase SurA